MSDAGGWTLLPGKNSGQSFFSLFAAIMYFSPLRCAVPGSALGESPWHKRKEKCPVIVLSLFVNGGLSFAKKKKVKNKMM